VVDAVLIPEVQFKLEGPTGLLRYLEGVLEAKGHAVVCLAEGAGQVRGGGSGVACVCVLVELWGPVLGSALGADRKGQAT